MAIPKFEADLNIISKLADKPNDAEGLSAQAFKEEFDRAGLLVKEYINEILVPQANIDIDNASKGIGGSEGMDGSTIVDGTVTASKLAANSVTAEKIAEDAVTAEKIAPKAVTEEAFADASVPTRAYKQGSVTTAALAQNSVTADKIAEGAVSGAKLADGSVGTAKIADAAVTRTKLAQEALYSPMQRAKATPYTVQLSDVGKTLAPSASLSSSTNMVFNIDNTLAAAPDGMEFAVFYSKGASLTIQFSGNQLSACAGHTVWDTNRSYVIPELFGMCAIKKVNYGTDSNYWLVTGNVEVVS